MRAFSTGFSAWARCTASTESRGGSGSSSSHGGGFVCCRREGTDDVARHWQDVGALAAEVTPWGRSRAVRPTRCARHAVGRVRLRSGVASVPIAFRSRSPQCLERAEVCSPSCGRVRTSVVTATGATIISVDAFGVASSAPVRTSQWYSTLPCVTDFLGCSRHRTDLRKSSCSGSAQCSAWSSQGGGEEASPAAEQGLDAATEVSSDTAP